ncbi:hypothetical protein YKV155 [Yokapox virus]|uniref:Protein OPG181 n=1 Tax=Yokapox virus TaxID=1076255 RepID=G3EI47_9POXV|nr:hypothetical protein YKV155 [Yokapox virus]AEN03744.1 unknown protein [Yokapox virus]
MIDSTPFIVNNVKEFINKSNEFDYIKSRLCIESTKKNTCRDLEQINVCDVLYHNNVIADIPYFDDAVSNKWNSIYNTRLYRVSRFGTLIDARNNDGIIYNFNVRNNIVNIIISLDDKSISKIISQDNTESKITTILKPSSAVILSIGSSFIIKGNSKLLIIIYDDCVNEAPLLKCFSADDVIISRHKRLHDELPNDNWFKFYICLTSDHCSKLYIVVNGAIIHAKADKKTHSVISHNYIDNDKINDECNCCYSETPIKILSKDELLTKSSCEFNRHCITVNIDNIGTLYSSILGKYDKEMINIVFSVSTYLINDRDNIAGRGNGYYIYGIATK